MKLVVFVCLYICSTIGDEVIPDWLNRLAERHVGVRVAGMASMIKGLTDSEQMKVFKEKFAFNDKKIDKILEGPAYKHEDKKYKFIKDQLPYYFLKAANGKVSEAVDGLFTTWWDKLTEKDRQQLLKDFAHLHAIPQSRDIHFPR